MKPSELQIRVIDSIIECLSGWKDINDIYSPSLENLDYSYLTMELEDLVPVSEIDDVASNLENLLYCVRNIKIKKD